jgi:hypothetical protein
LRKVIYSMGVSLDGFVADRDGQLDWGVPDEELMRFHNEQTREIGAQACGRGRQQHRGLVDQRPGDRHPPPTSPSPFMPPDSRAGYASRRCAIRSVASSSPARCRAEAAGVPAS